MVDNEVLHMICIAKMLGCFELFEEEKESDDHVYNQSQVTSSPPNSSRLVEDLKTKYPAEDDATIILNNHPTPFSCINTLKGMRIGSDG
jgi:hypothetical protein